MIAEELQLVDLVGWRRNKRERTCAGRKNLGRPDPHRCGSTGSAAGRIVVLAAHAIETPQLLLMSRDGRTPKGVPVLTFAIREIRDGPFRKNHSAIGTSFSNEGWRRAMGPQATA